MIFFQFSLGNQILSLIILFFQIYLGIIIIIFFIF